MAELKKREKIMAVVAGACLLVFLVYQFVCSNTKDPAQQSEKKAAKKETLLQAAIAAVRPDAKINHGPVNKTLKFDTWGRDPFTEAYRLAPFDTTVTDSESYVLRGIIRKGNDASVLIGDEILKEGQGFGDLKVIDIKKSEVICKKGNKLVTLVLNDEKN